MHTSPPSSTQLPKRIGRYELLATLGRGGMGQVFRAKLRGPGEASKPVALKVIHDDLSKQRDFETMFMEEARIAMALAHRNIVQTFDGGGEDKQLFLVMELVDGWSVAELMHGSLVPLDVAAFVAMEVCAALAYAHGFLPEHTGHPGGVVHRDVSPSNILVSKQGDVKLGDFGVAKAAGRIDECTIERIHGKLAYMAPEQARGAEQTQSDLFSLGAVLYELLGGRRFRQEATLGDVANGTISATPLNELRPDTPPSLAALISRCLATDPAERPASATELRRLLSLELAGLAHEPEDAVDPQGRLCRYLATRFNQSQPNDRSRRLADLVVQEALALPTTNATGLKPDEIDPRETESSATLDKTVQTPPTLDSPLSGTSPAAPRPWVMPTVIAALALGVALGMLAYASLSREETPSTARRTRHATQPPAIANAQAAVAEDTGRVEAKGQNPTPHPPQSTPSETTPSVDRAPTRQRRTKRAAARRRTSRRAPQRRKGLLRLNSTPWARVLIDGVYVGETPIEVLTLAAGSHRVRLENRERNLTKVFNLKISGGKTTTRVVSLSGRGQ